MRYVAAYLLSALGGKESPSTGDIKKILESVGIEVDDTRMSKVVSELNGKNLEEVIAQVGTLQVMLTSGCSNQAVVYNSGQKALAKLSMISGISTNVTLEHKTSRWGIFVAIA
uniref:Large ribosomal subunit protein P2 n=1 Tax=Sinocyclocheilus grahami TaxID=75366 RepID=A0A672PDZ3_SINGR